MKLSISYLFPIIIFCSMLSASSIAFSQQIGDNLGSHTATTDLNMNGKTVYNISGLAIGTSSFVNASSVALQITGNKAILLPRLSSLATIVTPVNGMIVFLTSDSRFYIYQGGSWTTFATVTLPAGNIYIGNAAGTAEAASVTGDLSLSNKGVSSIVAGAITSTKINNLAITSAKITDGSLITADFPANAVTTALVADLSITSPKIADGAATNVKLASNSLSPANFDSNTAGVSKALLTDDNGDHTWVNLSQILVPPLASARMIIANSGGVPSGVLLSGDVTMSNTGVTTIAPNAVNTIKIKDGSLNTADFANSSVTAAKISRSTMGNNKVMTTNNEGSAEWADQALVQGFVVGDIKPYFPSVAGTALPTNWVMCNGQTLSVTGSPLNGKVLPNLNNNTFLIGSKAASGVVVGSNTVMISQSNLPPVVPNVTAVGLTEIIPAGTITVADAGEHTHTLNDPSHNHTFPYDGDENGAKPGKVKSTDRGPAAGNVPVLSAKTGITIRNDGVHNHAAAFSAGNTLGAHAHPGMISSSINGGVAQTAISNIPSSITVWWIMKVR